MKLLLDCVVGNNWFLGSKNQKFRKIWVPLYVNDTTQYNLNWSRYIILFPAGKMASLKHDGELSSLIPDDRADANRANTRCPLQKPASRRKRYLVVLCILFVELCERLTFYGVTVNLVFYCKDVLKLASPLPSTITLAFQGKATTICNIESRD